MVFREQPHPLTDTPIDVGAFRQAVKDEQNIWDVDDDGNSAVTKEATYYQIYQFECVQPSSKVPRHNLQRELLDCEFSERGILSHREPLNPFGQS